MTPIRVAALLTVHNRKQTTLACLASLVQTSSGGASVDIFVVDDGSTDGTSEAIREQFPRVHVVSGDGSLYWNGGMRKAYQSAVGAGIFDYFLWLNDDTHLFAGALELLINTAKMTAISLGCPTMIVGTTKDRSTGEPTYGGRLRRSLLRPLYFDLVIPADTPQPCDTVNGNCVLIPDAIVRSVGWLDTAYVHGMGDYDYGFRVRRKGFPIFVAAGYIGTCSRNPPVDRQSMINMPFHARWRRITSPKFYPFPAWLTFARRHLGPLWPFFLLRPYAEAAFPRSFRRLL